MNAKRSAASPLVNASKRRRNDRQSDAETAIPGTELSNDLSHLVEDVVAGPSSSTGDVFGDVVGNMPSPAGPSVQVPSEDNLSSQPESERIPSCDEPGPSTFSSSRYGPLSDKSRSREAQRDDIKLEYHHSAHKPADIYAFEDFKRSESEARSNPIGEPWAPFDSRTEFEFAELAHEARLSKRQIKRLLKLIDKISSRKDRFSFKTSDDVDRAWTKAKQRYPLFSKSEYTVEYQNTPQKFNLHSRSLWEWILLQIQDPYLASYFQWDAQRLSKFNGTAWVRFYDEPWTADKFAQVQDEIIKKHPHAKPLAIILWADTAKLSTFGSQKGHFIVARVGNLPEHVRNGGFLGGGRIVGFLPIVAEDQNEIKKPRWVDFKAAVFHEAFRVFLEDVACLSEVGYQVLCGDQITRVLFPYIHIISADYEEQTVFALNRGLKGLFPCPVCHIPQHRLSDIMASSDFRLRTNMDAQTVFNTPGRIGAKRGDMKNMGMRLVQNAFWNIANTDVHEAMSFDRLHAYTIGLWQKHLFKEFKNIVLCLSRQMQARVEERVNTFPRWSKLHHFTNILKLDYADGDKWEDVAKIIIHVSYEVFEEAECARGLALLCLIRKWQELNMFLSLKVQTDDTIDAFTRTLPRFQQAVEEYKSKSNDDMPVPPKDWNFIKIHSHTHAARDIRLKGALNNMDTKPNEKLNGAMREAYHKQTNFKNVEAQLGDLEDCSMVAKTIRAHIDSAEIWALEDEEEKNSKAGERLPEEEEDSTPASKWTFSAIYIGSRLPPTSIESFVSQGGDDPAFSDFIPKLQVCMQDIIVRQHFDACERDGTLSRAGPQFPSVRSTDLVTECRYVKAGYESMVDWRQDTDALRCNPSFHGSPRYDSAIFHWTRGNILAPIVCKLIRFFVYWLGDTKYPLALVQPMTEPVEARPWDLELGLCRIRERPRNRSMIVPLRSLIRGVVVVPDDERRGQYTVMDMTDNDVFLRLMPLFPNRDMEMTF
ncbi:hypothetical protein BDY19DRAFT_928654 [Irpex rosettiformis]|uniref:Uncharacterized protein n=1 Tax=Irpex rosettiformis TaxID=378272 RepID=A0ACB8UD45_9APHY|nr:hypothetical protein BDY19DRAFT_928654 [Irpex rosettiformis]